jgi:type IV secretory pathway TrbL component
MGGNDAGATHTINVGEISLPEVLVSYVANQTSGSGIWTWNGSLPAPVSAMGVQLSNYSTVLQIYDPDYTTTNMIGNTTFINLFTNACATPQAEAMQLLMTLGGLELSNAAAALSGGNSTMPMSSGAMESSMPMSSMAMSSAESAMSSVESATSSAASGASSAESSATSAASSAASGAASSAESAASGVTSAAASAASSAAAAVTSTSA